MKSADVCDAHVDRSGRFLALWTIENTRRVLQRGTAGVAVGA